MHVSPSKSLKSFRTAIFDSLPHIAIVSYFIRNPLIVTLKKIINSLPNYLIQLIQILRVSFNTKSSIWPHRFEKIHLKIAWVIIEAVLYEQLNMFVTYWW